FPITCAYLWNGEIQQESETVLIVKAKAGVRELIEAIVRQHIDYTHFVGELPLSSVNDDFVNWFFTEIG
ncbi:MAG: divalent cation tolerance protein CutA, partial [Fimbriimonadales bacterium]|nr:divalent cation tolerance protein CutA [Fimbriimonadales bacterium]